jgi:Predicted metal-binding, possibly nucleic acid-binding protein
MTSFSLRQVKLRPGEQFRDELEVELSPLEYGGQRYLPVPEKVPAELEITRANTGTVFSLAFTARLFGPCYRCLGDAVLELPIRAREYQAESPDDEELTTEYVVGNMLEVSAWARDAIALALPDKILCRDDCAGLCAVCGKNLNDEPHTHDETPSDSRWAALEALREKL